MAGVPSTFNDIYNNLYENLVSKTSTVESPTVDPSAIKSMLKQSLRPSYDKQIATAKTNAATSRAAYDADAASRGMGTSTWLSDVKNRNANNLNTTLNDIESDYNSSLYSNLLSQIQQQQSNKLTTDQFNASAKNAARDSALSMANTRYDDWKKKKSSGSKTPTTNPTNSGTTGTLPLTIALRTIASNAPSNAGNSGNILRTIKNQYASAVAR